MGGHGTVSTVGDYMNFCLMLLNDGFLTYNSFMMKTVEYMTSNHLGR